MNIHFPQTHNAIAEAKGLIATHEQYIVPTDGSPIRGLIQDFIIASCRMTSKDTFLNREQYNQIIYAAFGNTNRRIRTIKPAIYKPEMLWTGKQVITTILKNFDISVDDDIQAGMNLTSKSKLDEKNWGELG